MAAQREVAENVRAFIDKASSLVGKVEQARWAEDSFSELVEGETKSPIEGLFYLAVKALAVATYNPLNPDPRHDSEGNVFYPSGIYLAPQHQLGKYRIDFVVSQSGIAPEGVCSPVAVELDGHAFHDKDKHQRAYEKRRDRDLVRAGYKVMHFTGSEVAADPFRVAYEVLEMLGVFEGIRDGYDPADPLGLEVR